MVGEGATRQLNEGTFLPVCYWVTQGSSQTWHKSKKSQGVFWTRKGILICAVKSLPFLTLVWLIPCPYPLLNCPGHTLPGPLQAGWAAGMQISHPAMQLWPAHHQSSFYVTMLGLMAVDHKYQIMESQNICVYMFSSGRESTLDCIQGVVNHVDVCINA